MDNPTVLFLAIFLVLIAGMAVGAIGALLTTLPWPVPRWVGVSAATTVALMLCGSGPVVACFGAVLAAVIAAVAPLPTSPARRWTAWRQSLALIALAVMLALLLSSIVREVLMLAPIGVVCVMLHTSAKRDRRRVEHEPQGRRMLGHALLETYSTVATAGWFWLGWRLWHWERIVDRRGVPRLVVWPRAIKGRRVFDCPIVPPQPGEQARIDAVRSQPPIKVLAWLTPEARRLLRRTLGVSPERVAALVSLSLTRGAMTEGGVSVLSASVEADDEVLRAEVRLVGPGKAGRVRATLTRAGTVVDLSGFHVEDDNPLADELGAS